MRAQVFIPNHSPRHHTKWLFPWIPLFYFTKPGHTQEASKPLKYENNWSEFLKNEYGHKPQPKPLFGIYELRLTSINYYVPRSATQNGSIFHYGPCDDHPHYMREIGTVYSAIQPHALQTTQATDYHFSWHTMSMGLRLKWRLFIQSQIPQK